MAPIKHILVPTDFGDGAVCALNLAIELARAFDARITLLHCFAVPFGAANELVNIPLDLLQDTAQANLDEAVATARARYPRIEPALFFGDPWQRIVTLTKGGNVDLVVMGTHGRRGVARVLLGSVAEKTVRTSPVPVLTVCAPAEPAVKEAPNDTQIRSTRPPSAV